MSDTPSVLQVSDLTEPAHTSAATTEATLLQHVTTGGHHQHHHQQQQGLPSHPPTTSSNLQPSSCLRKGQEQMLLRTGVSPPSTSTVRPSCAVHPGAHHIVCALDHFVHDAHTGRTRTCAPTQAHSTTRPPPGNDTVRDTSESAPSQTDACAPQAASAASSAAAAAAPHQQRWPLSCLVLERLGPSLQLILQRGGGDGRAKGRKQSKAGVARHPLSQAEVQVLGQQTLLALDHLHRWVQGAVRRCWGPLQIELCKEAILGLLAFAV